ncbi:hypothetical protein OIDMADRAFT_31625 [Oidiodendron maius Zn]|uniref:Transcription factor domain-containing protein n=1 Tax=Oidiodendron maius (strain Zn) TaxID=913774 RepID=A0A0C3H5I2_OIDMZ|nr:hypothetical protein OIDMADRAFT_31625 [Oidiodendron maius Zn]
MAARSARLDEQSNNSSSLIFIHGSSSQKSQIFDEDQPVSSSSPRSESKFLLAGTSTPEQQNNSSNPIPSSSSSGDLAHLYSSQTFTALELDNLRLMRHYFTHAWHSMVSDTEGDIKDSHHNLWHEIIPGLAVTYPFLLHAILSVSAVHFALTTPADSTSDSTRASMANLAQHHLTLSLPLMRHELSTPIDSISIQPLFACAAFIAMYAFGHSQIPNTPLSADPLEQFSQAVTMLNGMAAIVHAGPSLLEDTPFKVAMLPTPSNPAAPLSPAVETYLTALQTVCVRMTWQEGSKEGEGYNFMIGILRYSFLLHREASGRQMTAVPFAVLLPEPVLSGVRNQQPFALCLVAGYAVVLHWLRRHLWIQGWGRRVMNAIWTKLMGTEWEGIITWPLQVVSSDSTEG